MFWAALGVGIPPGMHCECKFEVFGVLTGVTSSVHGGSAKTGLKALAASQESIPQTDTQCGWKHNTACTPHRKMGSCWRLHSRWMDKRRLGGRRKRLEAAGKRRGGRAGNVPEGDRPHWQRLQPHGSGRNSRYGAEIRRRCHSRHGCGPLGRRRCRLGGGSRCRNDCWNGAGGEGDGWRRTTRWRYHWHRGDGLDGDGCALAGDAPAFVADEHKDDDEGGNAAADPTSDPACDGPNVYRRAAAACWRRRYQGTATINHVSYGCHGTHMKQRSAPMKTRYKPMLTGGHV